MLETRVMFASPDSPLTPTEMKQGKLHVDAAVQTEPRLLAASGELLSPTFTLAQDGLMSHPPTVSDLQEPPSSAARSRRHSFSNYSLVDTRPALIEHSIPLYPESHLPPPRPSPRATLQMHTPKRLSDPETRFAIKEGRSPISSANASVSSDSDSVEIIYHRSSFNSPIYLDGVPERGSVPASDEEELKADDEGWIRCRSSPPQPIPALHGPLSLPYARCPSGAEGTVMSGVAAPSQLVWGLGERDEDREIPPNSKQHAQSEASTLAGKRYGSIHSSHLHNPYLPMFDHNPVKAAGYLPPVRSLQNPTFSVSPPGPVHRKYGLSKVQTRRNTSPGTPLPSQPPQYQSSLSARSSPSGLSTTRIIGSPFAPRIVSGPVLSPEMSPVFLSSMLALAGSNVNGQGVYLPTPPNSTSPLWTPAFSPRPIQIIDPNRQAMDSGFINHPRSISAVLDNSNQFASPRANFSPGAGRGDIILTHLRRSSALAADATTNRIPPTPPTPQSPRVDPIPRALGGLRKSTSMEFRYLGQSPTQSSHLRHARSLHLRNAGRRDLTPVPEEDNSEKDRPGSSYASSRPPSPNQHPGDEKAASYGRRSRVRVKLPANSKACVIRQE